MLTCNVCSGNELDDSRYCSNCGARLGALPPTSKTRPNVSASKSLPWIAFAAAGVVAVVSVVAWKMVVRGGGAADNYARVSELSCRTSADPPATWQSGTMKIDFDPKSPSIAINTPQNSSMLMDGRTWVDGSDRLISYRGRLDARTGKIDLLPNGGENTIRVRFLKPLAGDAVRISTTESGKSVEFSCLVKTGSTSVERAHSQPDTPTRPAAPPPDRLRATAESFARRIEAAPLPQCAMSGISQQIRTIADAAIPDAIKIDQIDRQLDYARRIGCL